MPRSMNSLASRQVYCDVTDWSCLSSQAPCLLLPKLLVQAWTAAARPSPTPVALRHSAAFNSSQAYFCPAVSVSSRAHRLAACPPRRAGRSRVVAIPICSPSVPLEKTSRHMRSHVSCDTNIGYISPRLE